MLFHETWLHLEGADSKHSDSPFTRSAEVTRDIDHPALRVAHCLRDLAHGHEDRSDDLVAMVSSNDPAYREMFRDAMLIE